jgi:hypothetical protein
MEEDMPKIRLKPFSTAFDDGKNAPGARCCDMPGCPAEGAHKAPRDRSLNSHFWFCLDHVQEYNTAWDFFSGMSSRDIEDHIVRSTLWDRPTRRFDGLAALEEQLYRKSWQTYHNTENEPKKEQSFAAGINRDTPEFQAMAIMALEPPLNMVAIKTRYRELVKKHHPDINRDDPRAEELLKSINMAYTILRLACEKYETSYTDGKK